MFHNCFPSQQVYMSQLILIEYNPHIISWNVAEIYCSDPIEINFLIG